MGKYKWNDNTLKNKSQLCDVLMLLCGLTAFGCYLAKVDPLIPLIPFVGCVLFYVLSWQMKRSDAKLKAKQ